MVTSYSKPDATVKMFISAWALCPARAGAGSVSLPPRKNDLNLWICESQIGLQFMVENLP